MRAPNRPLKLLGLLLLFVLSGPRALLAQPEVELSGVVHGVGDVPLVGANVAYRNLATGDRYLTTTDPAGTYQLGVGALGGITGFDVLIYPAEFGGTYPHLTVYRELEPDTNPAFPDTLPAVPSKVLFVGNSYTAYNGGLAFRLLAMVGRQDPDHVLISKMEVAGGYSLDDHLNDTDTIDAIRTGGYDVVILQEQSTRPADDPDLMFAAARSLDAEIRAAGARTAFFMTWAREYDPPMIELVAAAYDSIGRELNALVVPVGWAFYETRNQYPDIDLFQGDGSHPSVAGTYLATCVFHAALFNDYPGYGQRFDGAPIDPQTQVDLQAAAWSAALQYYQDGFEYTE